MVEARHRHKLQHQSNGWVWAMSWSFNYGLSLIFCYSSGYVLNNSESNNEHYIENALFGKFISITINWLMSFFGKRLWIFVLTSKKTQCVYFGSWLLMMIARNWYLIPVHVLRTYFFLELEKFPISRILTHDKFKSSINRLRFGYCHIFRHIIEATEKC